MAGGGPGRGLGRGRGAAAQPVERVVVYDYEIDLGIIQLQVDGDNVSFGNEKLTVSIHKTKAAISIDNPSEFKNYDSENEELAELDLEGVNYAIELTLQPDGSWTGSCNTAGTPATSGRRRSSRAAANAAKGVYVFLEKAELGEVSGEE